MEGLIIMAVIALLTRLFSNNSDEQKEKQSKPPVAMPPFSNDKPLSKTVIPQPARQRTKPVVQVKSLEDFAQEVFGQLQQKTEQTQKPIATPVVTEQEPVAVQQTTTSNRPVFQNRAESGRTGLQERKELGADRPIIQRNKKTAVTIPTTRKELVQSIVMAEVLGQPKAKRPHRI